MIIILPPLYTHMSALHSCGVEHIFYTTLWLYAGYGLTCLKMRLTSFTLPIEELYFALLLHVRCYKHQKTRKLSQAAVLPNQCVYLGVMFPSLPIGARADKKTCLPRWFDPGVRADCICSHCKQKPDVPYLTGQKGTSGVQHTVLCVFLIGPVFIHTSNKLRPFLFNWSDGGCLVCSQSLNEQTRKSETHRAPLRTLKLKWLLTFFISLFIKEEEWWSLWLSVVVPRYRSHVFMAFSKPWRLGVMGIRRHWSGWTVSWQLKTYWWLQHHTFLNISAGMCPARVRPGGLILDFKFRIT